MRIKEPSALLKKIETLKKEVAGMYGRKILSSTDCLGLSTEIYKKTGHTLNTNTLRRFFGLVPYNFLPSQSTRDILSLYCGYASFDEVEEAADDALKSQYVRQENVVNFLANLFKMEIQGCEDPTFHKMVKETLVFLNRNPYLKKHFQQEVAKTEKGLEFYFEKYIDLDNLNTSYGEGLRLYLNEKRSEEGEIFAHSMLAMRYWLTMEDKKLDKHFSVIMGQRLHKSLQPVLAAKYFSSLLLGADAKGLPHDALLAEADEFYSIIRERPDQWSNHTSFELIWAQALALTGHYEECLIFISHALLKFGTQKKHKDESFHQSLLLWKTFAMVHLNNIKEAEKTFEKIRPEAFNFLFKKYETMIYLHVVYGLKKATHANYFSQLENLVADTGFVRLKRLGRKAMKMVKNEQS